MHITKWKKPIWKGYILCNPNYMTFWKMQNYRDRKESACNAGNLSSVPGLGRFPGEGNGYPLQYFCLENPKDRGAWQTTVHGWQRVRHDCGTNSFTSVIWGSILCFLRVYHREWLQSDVYLMAGILSFLSSSRTHHQLTICGGCNCWWLSHPLLTDMAGDISLLKWMPISLYMSPSWVSH